MSSLTAKRTSSKRKRTDDSTVIPNVSSSSAKKASNAPDITFKSNKTDNVWLSNFWPFVKQSLVPAQPKDIAQNAKHFSLTVAGKSYKSVEHYYHTQKWALAGPLFTSQAEFIQAAPTAVDAKKRNRQCLKALKPDDLQFMQKFMRERWDDESVMREALFAKYSQNECLKVALLSTGDKTLGENSGLGDRNNKWVWRNQNLLGKLTAQVRTQLAASK